MPIFSNVDQVAAWLDDCVREFRFDLPGMNESIGYDCAIAVAEGIQERSYQRQMGASEIWPENSEEYAEYKHKHYDSDKINVRTGQMLSMGSLTADITIEDHGDTVVMCYGTGDPPRFSANGYMEESDREVTDKIKAAEAHFFGRPFFQVDQDIDNQRVMPILKECLGQYLQDRANK